MKANLFLVAALGAFLFSSCAKKTAPPSGPAGPTYDDSYTINGGGWHNTVYNISNISSKTCHYDSSSHTTTVNITGLSGDSVTIYFAIVFAGNSAKTYSLTTTGTNVVSITNTLVKNSNQFQDITSNPGATLTVTNYGHVGGTITGTFSGSFNYLSDNYTVSNGTFSAIIQ